MLSRTSEQNCYKIEFSSHWKNYLIDEEIQKHLKHLMQLRDPSILGCKNYDFSAGKSPTLYMEHCTSQTLLNLMSEGKQLSDKKILEIALTLINGLLYYERQDIPTSIEPDHIMVCKDGQVKILDHSIFGILAQRTKTFVLGDNKQPGSLGLLWMAPELLQSRNTRLSFQTAVFSFGCILLYMYKKIPAISLNAMCELLSSNNCNYYRDVDIPSTCPSYLSDMIRKCLDSNPTARLTITEIKSCLEHQLALTNQIDFRVSTEFASASASQESKLAPLGESACALSSKSPVIDMNDGTDDYAETGSFATHPAQEALLSHGLFKSLERQDKGVPSSAPTEDKTSGVGLTDSSSVQTPGTRRICLNSS